MFRNLLSTALKLTLSSTKNNWWNISKVLALGYSLILYNGRTHWDLIILTWAGDQTGKYISICELTGHCASFPSFLSSLPLSLPLFFKLPWVLLILSSYFINGFVSSFRVSLMILMSKNMYLWDGQTQVDGCGFRQWKRNYLICQERKKYDPGFI